MKGILAALAAMLLAGLQQKQGATTPTSGTGYTPTPYIEPTTPTIPGPTIYPGYPGETFKEEFHPPGIKMPDVYKMPDAAASAGEQLSFNLGIIETMPATIPEAIPDPLRMTSRVVIQGKQTGWTWYTPQGPITSRPPTPEEEESGLGCPEIPGIWEYPMSTVVRYCSNMECPSNKQEYDYTSHEWLEPTPAQLEQQVDAAGNISYFCRVCRTYQ